jgi:hypothetical protein
MADWRVHARLRRGIAEACAANLGGVPLQGISTEDALAQDLWPAWLVAAFGLNNCASGAKATRELRWPDAGKQTNMLEDIATGSYKQK